LTLLRLRFIALAWLGAMVAWIVGERVAEGTLPGLGALSIGSPIVLALAVVASAPLFARLSSLVRLARDVDVAGVKNPLDGTSGPQTDELTELRRILLDVKRRHAETSRLLLTQQNLSARIFDGMQEGVMLVDANRRVLACNPALREMLLLRSDAIGKPLIEVVRHAELDGLLSRVGKEAAPSGEIELSGLAPRRVLVSASALTGSDGGVLLVFFDVTALRKLESLRRDFVANVSHELRTPVTSVLSGAETLRMVLASDPSRAEPFVDIIERNAERLRLLIEDLLDLSRIESKGIKLAPETLRLRSVVVHVLDLFRERAAKRGLDLRTEIAEDLVLFADRRAIEQVLTNLVDNAVKYGKDGGAVTVAASAAPPFPGNASSKISLSVHDDGPGVPKQHLPRLFERFYRVDAGRSRELGGTGLGLAIAKHLVEAMHGSIGVDSGDGDGTRFEVLLPRGTDA